MDFASFVARAKAFDPTGLDSEAARKLGRLFDRGVPVAEVATRWSPELGGHAEPTYRRARELWHEHRRWRQALQGVSARRAAAGLVVLPEEVVQRTWDEEDMSALERAAERVASLRSRSHGAWHDALLAVTDARGAALTEALAEARVRLGSEEDAVLASAVAPDEWLEASADADGQPELTLPEGVGDAAVEALAKALARLDEGLDAATIARELVLPDLLETTRRALSRRAIVRLMASAEDGVRARLAAKPVTAPRALGLFVGAPGEPSAAALVPRDGGTPKTHVAEPVDGPVSALAFLMEHARPGDAWVLPERAADPDGLAAALDALPEGAALVRVPADGLPEAAPGPAAAPAASRAAVALARRALDPERAWRALAPDAGWFVPPRVRLDERDAQRLAERVSEALGATPGATRGAQPATAADPRRPDPRRRQESPPRSRDRVSGTPERPNPGLERLSDLEPGMRLRGHVASINRYGAFVDVGLPKEGLVPIHTLPEGASEKPAEVAKNGQAVDVRVISVDAARGRFELALEAVHDTIRPPARRSRSGGSRSGGSRGDGARAGGGRSSSRRGRNKG
ncbi:MAG: S1 RNA-binding domain-containing protein [Deltaproteobacteria bacterium]|nr:S1 RNA-binding domain-containing protein [Deltaproteobacteria bacterium]MCB9789114.1 S1 RNA-binding domain-containing protein [Deltaproteobacteria bacterium]